MGIKWRLIAMMDTDSLKDPAKGNPVCWVLQRVTHMQGGMLKMVLVLSKM